MKWIEILKLQVLHNSIKYVNPVLGILWWITKHFELGDTCINPCTLYHWGKSQVLAICFWFFTFLSPITSEKLKIKNAYTVKWKLWNASYFIILFFLPLLFWTQASHSHSLCYLFGCPITLLSFFCNRGFTHCC